MPMVRTDGGPMYRNTKFFGKGNNISTMVTEIKLKNNYASRPSSNVALYMCRVCLFLMQVS